MRIGILSFGAGNARGLVWIAALVLLSEQAGRVGLALGAVRRLEAKLPAGSVWRATFLRGYAWRVVPLSAGADTPPWTPGPRRPPR